MCPASNPVTLFASSFPWCAFAVSSVALAQMSPLVLAVGCVCQASGVVVTRIGQSQSSPPVVAHGWLQEKVFAPSGASVARIAGSLFRRAAVGACWNAAFLASRAHPNLSFRHTLRDPKEEFASIVAFVEIASIGRVVVFAGVVVFVGVVVPVGAVEVVEIAYLRIDAPLCSQLLAWSRKTRAGNR